MTMKYSEEENKRWQRTLPKKISSACIAIRHKDRVLMVKAHYKDYWTFPGGVIDENESPKAAAIRETFEEIGIKYHPDDVKFLLVAYVNGKNGHLEKVDFVFTAELLNEKTIFHPQEQEIEKAEWVNISKIAEYSDNIESYVNIQRIILNKLRDEHYIEVS